MKGQHLHLSAQHIFFVGTAAPEGRINLSPKGGDSLRVHGPNRVIWRNIAGSGNETAGHLRAAPRIALMWCSFDARPIILRAYGTAQVLHRGARQAGQTWTSSSPPMLACGGLLM